MVRLMHSMVRYNALKRSDRWDLDVYGIPVPQVDQMPAGLINIYLLARQARRRGARSSTPTSAPSWSSAATAASCSACPRSCCRRARRHPPRHARARGAAARRVRRRTCGALVRATMAAYLRPGHHAVRPLRRGRREELQQALFIRAFAPVTASRRGHGRLLGPTDLVRIAVTAPFIIGRFAAVSRQPHPGASRHHRRIRHRAAQAPPGDLRQARVHQRRGALHPSSALIASPHRQGSTCR